jgi:uncharacterized protein YjbI with pentapeptide repeats
LSPTSFRVGDHVSVDWPDDDPCDGTLGVDARALMNARGSLVGYRVDVQSGYVLSGRDYRHAEFAGADLHGLLFAKNYQFVCADLRLATLTRIHFLRSDLRKANLRGATLRGASMSACDLREADLRDTDLRDVRFGVASTAAGWRGSNLDGALFDGADLRGAKYRPETIWPAGFEPAEHGAMLNRPGDPTQE